MSNVAAFAEKLLGALPSLISSGVNVVQTINSYRDKMADMAATNRAPTQQEWDELNQRIANLRSQLHSGGG